jgi:DNA-binding MarR family transcriptional regulator
VNPSDSELQLLETIYSKQGDSAALSQRELAGAAGLSLGMTNALLRRFIERGWVKLMHLSGRSLTYILTTDGMEEVLRRSISYFARAVRSASLYRDKIDVFVRRLAKEDFSVLVLEGPAELDFLFDYSCERYGLDFVKNPAAARREALLALPGAMFVMTELSKGRDNVRAESDGGFRPGMKASRIHLSRVLYDFAESRTGEGESSR